LTVKKILGKFNAVLLTK